MSLPFNGRESRSIASIGRMVRGGHPNQVARIDATGPVLSNSVITFDTPVDATAYTISGIVSDADGVVVAAGLWPITTTAASIANIRDHFLAAIGADGTFMPFISSLETASTTLTVTALSGYTVALTEVLDAGSDISIANNAASAAPQYLWGRAYEVRPDMEGITQGIRAPAALSGGTITLTITHAASSTYTAQVIVDGTQRTISFASGGNAGATDDAAEAAASAAVPEAVVTNPSTGSVVLTFAAGISLAVISVAAVGESSAMTAAAVQGSAVPRYCLAIDDHRTLRLEGQAAPLGPQIGGVILTADSSGKECQYAVQSPGSVSLDAKVYVETASGANLGRLYSSPSGTRALWREAAWVRNDPGNSNLAHVAF
jgi:hypothetical protein